MAFMSVDFPVPAPPLIINLIVEFDLKESRIRSCAACCCLDRAGREVLEPESCVSCTACRKVLMNPIFSWMVRLSSNPLDHRWFLSMSRLPRSVSSNALKFGVIADACIHSSNHSPSGCVSSSNSSSTMPRSTEGFSVGRMSSAYLPDHVVKFPFASSKLLYRLFNNTVVCKMILKDQYLEWFFSHWNMVKP